MAETESMAETERMAETVRMAETERMAEKERMAERERVRMGISKRCQCMSIISKVVDEIRILATVNVQFSFQEIARRTFFSDL